LAENWFLTSSYFKSASPFKFQARHHCENVRRFFLLFIFIFFRKDPACALQWPTDFAAIAHKEIEFLDLKKTERTEITSYKHCTTPEQHWVNKKDSNTKKNKSV